MKQKLHWREQLTALPQRASHNHAGALSPQKEKKKRELQRIVVGFLFFVAKYLPLYELWWQFETFFFYQTRPFLICDPEVKHPWFMLFLVQIVPKWAFLFQLGNHDQHTLGLETGWRLILYSCGQALPPTNSAVKCRHTVAWTTLLRYSEMVPSTHYQEGSVEQYVALTACLKTGQRILSISCL